MNSDEIVDVRLTDEYGMPIQDENVSIVKQFKNCSHFFIEICANFRQTDINNLAEVSVSSN